MKLEYFRATYLALPLGLGIMSHNAFAQKTVGADTLRRNLTVMTSEVVELGEKQPVDHIFVMTKPSRVTPTDLTPQPLPLFFSGLRAPVLMGLDSLAPVPITKPQLGYLSASVGLPTRVQISTGLRPVNTSSKQLDLHLAAHWGKYTYVHHRTLMQTLQEQALRLGIGYKQQAKASYYKLTGSFYTDKYTGQGLVYHERSWAEGLQTFWREQAKQRTGYSSSVLHIGGEMGSRPIGTTSRRWEYVFKPEIGFAKRADAHDIYLDLVSQMRYSSGERSWLNLGADLSTWSCNPYKDGSNYRLSLVSLAPSWSKEWKRERMEWYAKLGAKIAWGSKERGRHQLLLAPDISLGVLVADWMRLELDIDGGIEGTSMTEIIFESPRFWVRSPESLTHTPFKYVFTCELLPLSNLSIQMRTTYARHHSISGIVVDGLLPRFGQQLSSWSSPEVSYLVPGHSWYYTDARHWSFGGAVRYRTKHWFDASLEAYYHHWLQDSGQNYVGGRPNFELKSNLSLKPTERYSFGLSYNVIGGYKHPIRFSLPDKLNVASVEHDFGLVAMLSATASYRLTSKFGLSAGAHYYTTQLVGASIGFPQERFAIKGAIDIRF